MIKKYICEKCDEIFNDKKSCLEHEKNCQTINTFICYKCGKEIEYTTTSEYGRNFDFSYNECWEINLGRAGYGSKLDGCDVKFNLCDDCLIEIIDLFTENSKENVYNSGSNFYYND